MFIGREAELKFLNDKYKEESGQLIVLYGRRRVEKTETPREFCKGKAGTAVSLCQNGTMDGENDGSGRKGGRGLSDCGNRNQPAGNQPEK